MCAGPCPASRRRTPLRRAHAEAYDHHNQVEHRALGRLPSYCSQSKPRRDEMIPETNRTVLNQACEAPDRPMLEVEEQCYRLGELLLRATQTGSQLLTSLDWDRAAEWLQLASGVR